MAEPLPISSAAPASASACPGCGKPVDPLRAGHVAIFGGQFLYYCNATCKAQHLLGLAAHIGDDVATLDPPAVAERIATAKPPPVSGEVSRPLKAASAPSIPPDAPSFPSMAPPDRISRASVTPPTKPSPALVAPPASTKVEKSETNGANGSKGPAALEATLAPLSSGAPASLRAPPTDEANPSTLRSPSSGPMSARAAAPSRANDRALGALSVAGVLAGLLVPAVSLIGDLGGTARLPLVVVAALSFTLRATLARRDPADADPWVTVVPVCGAAIAAVVARAQGEPHALGIAWFAGVAAAVALLVEMALVWARRDVEQVRERIARALEVPVRIVRADGVETAITTPAKVKPGEQVVVAEGEMVGVDGIVVAGEATVVPWFEAPIELRKVEGDAVVAGARVVSGRLRLTTTWAAQDRAWTKLTQSRAVRVDVASPIVRFARGLAPRGAPLAAVVVAVAAFANNASTVEIVAAACAAAMALAGRGVVGAAALVHAKGQLAALEHGVVYKDATAFDGAGRTDVAVVCSRGTVLTGEPEIVALEPLGPEGSKLDVARLISLAAGAETASTHPFAAAILRAARARSERPENVRSATVHAGLGVTALASNGEHLVVGSRALLLQEKVSIAVADARISELEAQGRSVLLVALGGRLVGLLALQDGLRAGARAAVQRLLDARIEPVLLSGEARETCETIGRALDIEHIRPEVLPVDRGAEVRALTEGGHVVAVIGHPSTDDGALGAADVSLAMCSAGATPGEWAVALASDDVRDAALALGVAHATRDRARIALVIGLVPGGLALLLLVFGIAGLLVAPLAVAIGSIGALVHARSG